MIKRTFSLPGPLIFTGSSLRWAHGRLAARGLSVTLGVSIATLLAISITGCTLATPSDKEAQPYVLILSKSEPESAAWIQSLKANESVTYVLSGYQDETPQGLLQRIPWLLQPGVDTIVYDVNLAGEEAVDSLRSYLQQNSPMTTLRVYADH